MQVNGEQLIKIICNKLKDEDVRLYDSNIINKLRKMTAIELNQATSLGDVTDWHNDRILKEQKMLDALE